MNIVTTIDLILYCHYRPGSSAASVRGMSLSFTWAQIYLHNSNIEIKTLFFFLGGKGLGRTCSESAGHGWESKVKSVCACDNSHSCQEGNKKKKSSQLHT